jgi:TIGR03009 family protein
MRRIMAMVLTSVIGAWTAGAAFGQGNRPAVPSSPGGAPGQGQAVVPRGAAPRGIIDARAAMAKMDQLLGLWEEQSSKIETLDAKFIREDMSRAWDAQEKYHGRAILKSPDYAFLDFQKVVGDKLVPYEQIRCTGRDVYHYRSANNQIFIYPMPAQQRERALQEGPLPFLFNMRAEEAKKRYDMILYDETLTSYVILIAPREQIDREAFIRADVILDKQRFLPDAIKLYAPNGQDTQTYWFRKEKEGSYIRTNVPVNDKNFEGLVLKGWDVIRNPGGEGRSSGVNAMVPPPRRQQPPPRR